MKPAPVDFRLLLLVVNTFFVLCVLIFGYLLFQKPVDDLLANFNKPVVPQVAARPSVAASAEADLVVNGIHEAIGLVYAEGFALVKANCTICHSAKLITQNRANREGWAQMIDWMQATQGLWDLGTYEPKILDYLAVHYAPEDTGRRPNLNVEAIEWYVLKLPD